MRKYKIVSDRPSTKCPLEGGKRHPADFVPARGEFRDAAAHHDREPAVRELCGKYLYRKRGPAHRAAVTQKRLLYG